MNLGHGKWGVSVCDLWKRLQHPVNIKETNPRLAKVIMSQFGGPDGELSASMRYLNVIQLKTSK